MIEPKGKLIVIEGTDGSGKKTQANLLITRLKKTGLKVVSISFPQYGKKSAGLVEEYLNGKYGPSNNVDPYVASLFFALDRFDLATELKRRLNEKYIVILDRYVDSNAAHQGGKIKDKKARAHFLAWLYDLEYKILGIPKPDLTVILRVPAKMGQALVSQKTQRLYIEGGKTHDGHEANLKHLSAAESAYIWLARKFPKDHVVIECTKGNKLLPPEKIHEKVWNIIKNEALS